MNFNLSGDDAGKDASQPHQQSAAEILDSSNQILEQAHRSARSAIAKQLNASKHRVGLDVEMYQKLYVAVATEISQLRTILEGAEAKEKERVWVKNQVQGELDDNRLVDGATGERNVFKRRGNVDPIFGHLQRRPKRLRFVMDVSSSMARFNGADRRLDRMAATSVMIMESFAGFGHKYDYSIVGHDGESPLIPFVEFGKPPRDQKERLGVIEMMFWNASFCMSGDNTLAATELAIKEVIREEADDYFVFVLSDANFDAYGISAATLVPVLTADVRVNTYAIFIAGDAKIIGALPPGRGFACLDTSKLPGIFKQIFASALIMQWPHQRL